MTAYAFALLWTLLSGQASEGEGRYPELSPQPPPWQHETYEWARYEEFDFERTYERFSFRYDIGDRDMRFLVLNDICAPDADDCTVRIRVRFMLYPHEQTRQDRAQERTVHERALHFAVRSDSGTAVQVFSRDVIDSAATQFQRGAAMPWTHWVDRGEGFRRVPEPGIAYDCTSAFVNDQILLMIREVWLARERERSEP